MKTLIPPSLLSLVLLPVLLLVLVLGACSKAGDKDQKAPPEAQSTQPAQPARTEGAGHAAKDVVPGSHEDWCEEHQVPESQCTLCDPSLAAAFKATGDWCEEHGLPTSHDRKHNPDLKIERPAKK